jgi:hypothetical protein
VKNKALGGRIQRLKKAKQTATMKRRSLKPKTKEADRKFLARVQVEPVRAAEL